MIWWNSKVINVLFQFKRTKAYGKSYTKVRPPHLRHVLQQNILVTLYIKSIRSAICEFNIKIRTITACQAKSEKYKLITLPIHTFPVPFRVLVKIIIYTCGRCMHPPFPNVLVPSATQDCAGARHFPVSFLAVTRHLTVGSVTEGTSFLSNGECRARLSKAQKEIMNTGVNPTALFGQMSWFTCRWGHGTDGLTSPLYDGEVNRWLRQIWRARRRLTFVQLLPWAFAHLNQNKR